MSDDLVERVARAMCASVEARTSDVNVVRALGYGSVEAFIDAAWPNYAPEARAAIAVCMEEAAKVADAYEPRCDVCPRGVAAAIRALAPK